YFDHYLSDYSSRISIIQSYMVCSTCHFCSLRYPIFDFQKQNCMTYKVQVKVMPLKELLDPQGKAVLNGLQNLGLNAVDEVRIGKTIELQLNADSKEKAKELAEEASKKLLANPVMEYYEIYVN